MLLCWEAGGQHAEVRLYLLAEGCALCFLAGSRAGEASRAHEQILC